MHPHVPRQVAGLREGLAARRALVRPLPAVHPHVPPQVAEPREGLAARRALVWPLPAVYPHVYSQVAGLQEHFAALRALVRSGCVWRAAAGLQNSGSARDEKLL